jgi:photosystem II stability/assembly factor-like uncharacterized protein
MPRLLRVLLAGVLAAGALAATAVNATAAKAPAAPAEVTGFAAAGPDDGWAIASGAVWHTGTAGATWQLQWQGRGNPVWVTATDSAHAWVLVACHSSCGRELLGTSDGGARWRVLATLPASVNRVQFGNDHVGVATSDACLANVSLNRCPGSLLVSQDGGTRWKVALTAAAPVFATVNAAGQLWAAATVMGGGMNSVNARFATSTDGGARWQRLGQVSGLGTLYPDVQMTLQLGAGGQLAWASIYDDLTCAMGGCSVADLLAAGNGGRWGVVNLPDRYPDECLPIEIALSAGWFAASRNGAACSPPLGLVYTHGPSGWSERPPWALTGITSLTAVSPEVAYAIGDQGVLSRTTDGGQHWTQVLPAPVPTGVLATAGGGTVFGAQDASGSGAILRAGPGQPWQQVADLPGVVTQLDFTSALDGYAATYEADAAAPWQLWATADGGVSWQPAGNLPGGNLTVVDGPWFTAGGQGMLMTIASGNPWNPSVGGSGAVREWTTSDGGANWTSGSLVPLGKYTLDGPASFAHSASGWTGWLDVANANVPAAAYTPQVALLSGGKLTVLPGRPAADGGLQVIGPGSGFAWDLDFGRHGAVTLVVDRTANGGRQWTRSGFRLPSAAADDGLPLVVFSSAEDGWLVAGGITYATADGGGTWRPLA